MEPKFKIKSMKIIASGGLANSDQSAVPKSDRRHLVTTRERNNRSK